MKKPQVWAHRGTGGWDRQYAPENTMPAFEKAVQMGADGVELDVQLTKDGEVVICHDEWLDRTSNGHGELRELTLAELKRLDFSKTHPEYGFTPIPTLAEFLDFMRGNELVINIELKTGRFRYPGLEEKTVRLVGEFGMAERVWYSSFNHESVMRAKEIARGSHFAFLLAQVFLDMPAYALRHGIEALHPDSAILGLCPDILAQAHTAGQRVHVWTVDSRFEMKEMCRLGVDAFVTDCPDNGRRIVDEYFSEQTDLGSRE